MNNDIEIALRDILVSEFDCTDEMIAPKSRLRQDLGLDEFELIELAGELESRFNIVIESDEFSALQTVEELVKYLGGRGASVGFDAESPTAPYE